MASETLESLRDPVEEKLEEAKAKVGEATLAVATARDAEKEAKADVRVLEGVLARLNGQPLGPGGKAGAKKKLPNVSDERLTVVETAVREVGNGTVREILTHLGWEESKSGPLREAIEVLRNQERVRMTGKKPREDGRGRGAAAFAVMS